MVEHIEDAQKKSQDQQIMVSYDQDAVDGKVPMPVTPDAITVVRKGSDGRPNLVIVRMKSGENKVFHLISPEENSSTNWHFQ